MSKRGTGEAHRSVMLAEVIAHLRPIAGETYLDGTFGAGGYSRAILEAAECNVIALDRDGTVKPYADALAAEYGTRFDFLIGRFGDMAALLEAHGTEKLDGIVLDIGVSSMQIDQAARGFSFREDGPLDMRMSAEGLSASDVVNGYDEKELADILFIYGEERASRRIAKAIVEARQVAPIARTRELSALVAKQTRGDEGKDPATRTFQALRIYVNDELGELERALEAAEQLLRPGGRLVVVVFHSLEDRIVKRFLDQRGRIPSAGSRHLPIVLNPKTKTPTFKPSGRKAVAASEAEIAQNPRSRSAKLRSAIRTDALSWTEAA